MFKNTHGKNMRRGGRTLEQNPKVAILNHLY
jgi:hypothetical protein